MKMKYNIHTKTIRQQQNSIIQKDSVYNKLLNRKSSKFKCNLNEHKGEIALVQNKLCKTIKAKNQLVQYADTTTNVATITTQMISKNETINKRLKGQVAAKNLEFRRVKTKSHTAINSMKYKLEITKELLLDVSKKCQHLESLEQRQLHIKHQKIFGKKGATRKWLV